MEDLTTGPLTRHLLKTTSFMLVTMMFQTLYFLIDLYWVGRLGTQRWPPWESPGTSRLSCSP
jgi:Na+-driven multidrug efflux pump